MNIINIIQDGVVKGIKALYDADVNIKQVNLSTTRKEFEGDYTVVVFPFTKAAKKKPDQIGEELGAYLEQELEQVVGYNVIKGFLNLVISDSYWSNFLASIYGNADYGKGQSTGQKVLVEFCSPNTNKPLHLGHVRNILLGWSSYKILEAAGHEVKRVQIVNDRGIAISKSMLAWKKFSGGETPASSNTKSDHFVGKYYVRFDKEFQKEYKAWQASEKGQAVLAEKKKEDQDEAAFFKAYKNAYFNEYSALGAEAKQMLLDWEAGNEETRNLWLQMNNWVYAGFEETYKNMGVEFDKFYYESDTYILGKEFIEKGLEDSLFYKKEDGSVWIDLEDAKLDHKLVLRSDGTSVYITQDIGTAEVRYQDYGAKRMVYVVGDEQNYHFKVLFEIMKRLERPYAEGLYHLSYGMVDLPTGRMKSREGTVVDADDLMAEVIQEAWNNSEERGAISDLSQEEQADIIRKIGLAALKFFIIKVDPQKRMVFNPKESVDLQGQTGPYIQNAYVRGQSIQRKVGDLDMSQAAGYEKMGQGERELIIKLFNFPNIVQEAAANYDPSTVANYSYELAKDFHRFYHDFPIMKAETPAAAAFRLQLTKAVGNVLKLGMDLLGIEMPERM